MNTAEWEACWGGFEGQHMYLKEKKVFLSRDFSSRAVLNDEKAQNRPSEECSKMMKFAFLGWLRNQDTACSSIRVGRVAEG